MFSVLYEDRDIEVRKYPPSRRTVDIDGHEYFLHFPYMVFARRIVIHPDSNQTGTFLYLAFAKEDDNFVYCPPLPNINNLFCVCLGRRSNWYGHFRQSIDTSFEELINRFWFTDSYGHWGNSGQALAANYARHRIWEKLSAEEVLERLVYCKVALDDLIIGPWALDYTDGQMQDCFNGYGEKDYAERVVEEYNRFRKDFQVHYTALGRAIVGNQK
jgi:hypothetical protein